VFTVPSGATIDGVTVRVMLKAGSAGSWHDNEVRLVIGGTAGTGDDKARSPTTYWPQTETEILYGGLVTWGLTLDDTDVNAAGFGASISATEANGLRNVSSVDYIEIQVDYTEAGAQVPCEDDLTTGVTTDASITKTAVINGSFTSGVTTDKSITKTTAIEDSLTTGVTTDKSVTKETEIFNGSIAFASMVASVEVIKSIVDGLTTGVTTARSVTKVTALSDSLTTAVTTSAAVTKETSIEEALTTAVTTDEEVQTVKSVEDELTTGVTTSASITKVAPVAGSATTGITSSASVTKITAISESTTTAITTDKTVDTVKSVEGAATTGVATSATVTKATSTSGSATTAVATSASVTKIVLISELLTTAVATDETVETIKPVDGELTTGITTSALVTKIAIVSDSLTTAITTDKSVQKVGGGDKNVSGGFTTAITADGEITLDLSRIFSDTVSTATAAAVGFSILVADGCDATDITEVMNYAPLEDVRVPEVSNTFSPQILYKQLVPLADYDNHLSIPDHWQLPTASTAWQSLDADVDDAGDQSSYAQYTQKFSPSPFINMFYTAVPPDFGPIITMKARFRLDLTVDPLGGLGSQDYTQIEVIAQIGAVLYRGFTDHLDTDLTNEIIETEVIALTEGGVNPPEINDTFVSFRFWDRIPWSAKVYAMDVTVGTISSQKQIDQVSFGDKEDTGAVSYGDKEIDTVTWAGKDGNIFDWSEKDIP